MNNQRKRINVEIDFPFIVSVDTKNVQHVVSIEEYVKDILIDHFEKIIEDYDKTSFSVKPHNVKSYPIPNFNENKENKLDCEKVGDNTLKYLKTLEEENLILKTKINHLLNFLTLDQDTSEIQTKQALCEKVCIRSRGERIDDYFRSLRYCKSYPSHSWFAPYQEAHHTSEALRKSGL